MVRPASINSGTVLQRLENFDSNKHFLTTDLRIQEKSLGNRILRFFFPSHYRPSQVALNLVKKAGTVGLVALQSNHGFKRFVDKLTKGPSEERIREPFARRTTVIRNEAQIVRHITSHAGVILNDLANKTSDEARRRYEKNLLKLQITVTDKRKTPSPRLTQAPGDASPKPVRFSQNGGLTYQQIAHGLGSRSSRIGD